MRVISGNLRGTKLYTLEGQNTRPTLDRVKESLFNIINFEIKGSIFLDLFAGSGAIGIEAASRGASKVIMCEKSKEAANIINKNLEKTKLKIVRMMEHKRYIVKKQKLRENKSRTSSMVILTLAIEVFAVLFIVLLIKEPSFNIGHWDDKGIMISSLVGIMTTLSIATLSTSYLSIMKRRR